ncbi:hypothetical protein ACFZAM_31925 [Streptomyces sp. NPDC008079]|uniref:hypothetical protein n=1 Tax=Streptomyces sp. NPDC008079 TaxID=3364806 RepID=UPI0036EAE278
MSYSPRRTVQLPVPGAFITSLPRFPHPLRAAVRYDELRPLLLGAPRTPSGDDYRATVTLPLDLLEPLGVLAHRTAQEWAAEPVIAQAALALTRTITTLTESADTGVQAGWAVVVTRPGHPPVRIGPVLYEHTAKSMAAHMRTAHGTARPAATLIDAAPYHPDGEHLPLLPADAYALADMIRDMPGDDGEGSSFPDLWTRLSAQYPYDEALRIWERACAVAELSGRDEEALA